MRTIARTPFFANKEEGTILLVADVKTGEKFRIGYGNPQVILNEGLLIQQQIDHFQPEAIMLFSCICRRFLMQQDVDKETMPYENIAPTSGESSFGLGLSIVEKIMKAHGGEVGVVSKWGSGSNFFIKLPVD